MIAGSGCHSPAISDLPPEYHFKNQAQIYTHIVGWQEPVREGAAAARKALDESRLGLEGSSSPIERRAQVQLMINQADGILDAVEKDGSWGVHAPKPH